MDPSPSPNPNLIYISDFLLRIWLLECSESAWSAQIHLECVGEGKVLTHPPKLNMNPLVFIY